MTPSREAFEKWFCEKWNLTRYPRKEDRDPAYPSLPTMIESAGEDRWLIWDVAWREAGGRK